MKANYLILLVAAAATIFSSCDGSKDEAGSTGSISMQVPGTLKQQMLIPITVSAESDGEATVRFEISGGEGTALGVVCPTEEVAFDAPYVYAGEPISIPVANGRVADTFYYIPLTPGQQTVTFQLAYTLNGEPQTKVCSRTLNVIDTPEGGFYPEVHSFGNNAAYQSLEFRNEVVNYTKHQRGCSVCVQLQSYPNELYVDMLCENSTRIALEIGEFYPIIPGIYNNLFEDWENGNYIGVDNLLSDVTLHLTFRDDYNRCKDVEVTIIKGIGKKDNSVKSVAGEYYLWPR